MRPRDILFTPIKSRRNAPRYPCPSVAHVSLMKNPQVNKRTRFRESVFVWRSILDHSVHPDKRKMETEERSDSLKGIAIQKMLSDCFNDNDDDDEEGIICCKSYPSTPRNASSVSFLTHHLILTSAANVAVDLIGSLGVTCIISAAPELPDVPLTDDCSYHKINIMDSPNSTLSIYFDQVADIIDQVVSSGGRAIVFCVAGVSRSATLCIAYLMKYHQLSLLDAYNYVKTRRPRIKPNCGFFKQLIEYERSLFMSNSVSMVFNELVRMDIPDVYDHEYQLIHSIQRRFKDRRRH